MLSITLALSKPQEQQVKDMTAKFEAMTAAIDRLNLKPVKQPEPTTAELLRPILTPVTEEMVAKAIACEKIIGIILDHDTQNYPSVATLGEIILQLNHWIRTDSDGNLQRKD